MSNISILLGWLIGSTGFLFLFWKRMKEDYFPNDIFSFGFIVLIFLLIGFFVGSELSQIIKSSIIFESSGLWFWLSFVFGSIGFAFAYLRKKPRFFETLEAAGLGFMFWFFAIALTNSIQKLDIRLLVYSLVIASLIALFFIIDKRYKTFTWYKSGRVGFAGLFVLGVFFLVRSILALIDPAMLSFIGKSDAIISSVASFVFFIILYNLGDI